MLCSTNWKKFLMTGGALLGYAATIPATIAAEAGKEDTVFEEIIVTANKRSESLRSVAGAISAVTGSQLSDMGAESLSDYITTLPGVHFNDYQPGVSEVIIRGVSASTYHEQGQTTVGYYINEIPLNEAGWPIVIPDVDTFDLERVEVLRGPQGSLYGAAALGGLVNYIAKEADPSEFDAAFEASIGSTRNAGEPNYTAKGMFNAPIIEDKLAVRVVALERFDAGFIDNIGTGQDGVNDLSVRGLRGSVVFTPSDKTKISWMTMYQETNLDDATYLTVPTLTRNTVVAEPHETEMLLHSLKIEQDLGFADLTVLGALASKESYIVFDYSTSGYLVAGEPTWSDGFAESDSKHFEARLASKENDSRFSWLVGVSYAESTKDSNDAVYQAGAADYIDANPDLFGGVSGSLVAPNDYISQYVVDQENEDFGIFGEVTFDVTDAISITAGGRYFDASSETQVIIPPSAAFIGSVDAVGTQFGGPESADGFTPKVTVKYQPNDDFMIFARYSEGFRIGGVNPNAGRLPAGTVDAAYAPDNLENYEIGTRFDLMENRLKIDLTAFHLKWSDMQVRLFTPAPFFYSYVVNAGGSEINGLELSAMFRANEVVDFSTNITYLDAEVSEFVPDTFAANGLGGYPEGTTLPGASKWSIANTLNFNFADVALAPRVSISHTYLSSAPVAFGSVTQRGGYHLVDARATLQVQENVEVAFYVENLFDKYGILNAPFGDFYPQPLGSITRPRSIGFKFSWHM
ncbi:TonB-dependent receptor [Kordiimonas pumila]|uniref:TonB-dependent receptor n=1 Tax=Kordiimonas pumila TaxID=2161677 RepID=A0ABV7D110_9PROT|nr:TonB-dependent receptor [Kordiimonas pumila]